eukprot:1160365-Pelagomonas_calceolata.AAC.3
MSMPQEGGTQEEANLAAIAANPTVKDKLASLGMCVLFVCVCAHDLTAFAANPNVKDKLFHRYACSMQGVSACTSCPCSTQVNVHCNTCYHFKTLNAVCPQVRALASTYPMP